MGVSDTWAHLSRGEISPDWKWMAPPVTRMNNHTQSVGLQPFKGKWYIHGCSLIGKSTPTLLKNYFQTQIRHEGTISKKSSTW